MLDTVVRRWSRLVPPTDCTADAAVARSREVALDHVIPCRVLVDRMIIHPKECRELLETSVVLAPVTKTEHIRLGGIFTHHERIYGRMLGAPVENLQRLGRQRYRAFGIGLSRLP